MEKLKVMIVSSDPMYLRVALAHFSKEPGKLLTVDNYQEASNILSRQKEIGKQYDVVIIDPILLAEKNGQSSTFGLSLADEAKFEGVPVVGVLTNGWDHNGTFLAEVNSFESKEYCQGCTEDCCVKSCERTYRGKSVRYYLLNSVWFSRNWVVPELVSIATWQDQENNRLWIRAPYWQWIIDSLTKVDR